MTIEYKNNYKADSKWEKVYMYQINKFRATMVEDENSA